jgi:hypothetical protein
MLGVRSYKHTAPNGAVPASSLPYERDVYSIGVRIYIALLTERHVLGVRSYKHTAPNGARFTPTAVFQLCNLTFHGYNEPPL